MRSALPLLFVLSVFAPACASETSEVDHAEGASTTSEDVTAASDTRAKNAIVKAATGLSFLSESDHLLVWVGSSTAATAPANAAFVHRTFNAVTDNDAMADKPLSKMKSETVAFESFASSYVAVAGEDPDNFTYHQQMTKVLNAVRSHLKNPIVIRVGRKSGSGNYLVGAISVYVIGTLPSGKIGGLFTVSVET